MSLRNQFVDIDQPVPKPVVRRAITESLRSQVAAPVVRQEQPVRQVAVPNKPAVSTKPEPVSKATIRSSPEAWRTYHRDLMRRRRDRAAPC